MKNAIVDLSYVQELSGNDPKYLSDVLDIFLTSVLPGLDNLKKWISEGKDWEAIYKQAHALKSSVSIVKIEGMYDRLLKIETIGRELVEQPNSSNDKEQINEVKNTFDQILVTFDEAKPIIEQELESAKAKL